MLLLEERSGNPASGKTPVRAPAASCYGRFLQADPLGYLDGTNLYNYVGSDPVNFIDPTGLKTHGCTFSGDGIEVCGSRHPDPPPRAGLSSVTFIGVGGPKPSDSDADGDGEPDEEIVVTGKRLPKVAKNKKPPPSPFDPKQDYCGSQGFNAPDGMFSKACYIHDNCYATPGASKLGCDLALAINIPIHSRRGILLSPVVGVAYSLSLIFSGLPENGTSRIAYEKAQGIRR